MHCSLLHANLLKGSISPLLGNLHNLQQLTLQSNSFTGSLPPALQGLPVRHLSIYGNDFSGALLLPSSSTLVIVVAHRNRFSCQIGGWSQYKNISLALLAPGNQLHAVSSLHRFSSPEGPRWEVTSKVPFLWVGSALQTWHWPFISIALGLLIMTATVAIGPGGTHQRPRSGASGCLSRLRQFVSFVPSRGVERAQLWFLQQLLPLGTAACVVMMPLYIASANWYTGCELAGEPLMHTTIAYMTACPAAEWATAVLACAFYGTCTALVLRFEVKIVEEYAMELEQPRQRLSLATQSASPLTSDPQSVLLSQSDEELPSTSQQPLSPIALCVAWFLITLLCCIVPGCYAVFSSLPQDTVFGHIPQPLLDTFTETSSFLLAVETSIIIPKAARRLGAHAQTTSRLIQATRLFVSLVVPVTAIVAINEDCWGAWKVLWRPCNDKHFFDIAPDYSETTGSIYNSETTWGSTPLLNTADVCDLVYRSGHCSRAVLHSMAHLLLPKLLYAALLLTSVRLLLYMPVMVRVKERVAQCFKPTYRANIALDKEFTGLLMYGDYALVFGFALPVVIPMVCVVFAIQTAVLHYAVNCLGMRAIQDGQPSLRYMWVSLALGYTFVTWFFWDNQLHGKWLVCVGIPVMVAAVIALQWRCYFFTQQTVGSPEPGSSGEPYHEYSDSSFHRSSAGPLAGPGDNTPLRPLAVSDETLIGL